MFTRSSLPDRNAAYWRLLKADEHLHLNPDWLCTVAIFAQSKYCLQGYAVSSTNASIWYGNLSIAHRRNSDVVEDAGDDFGFVRVVIGKYEDKAGKKVPANITLAAVIPIILNM